MAPSTLYLQLVLVVKVHCYSQGRYSPVIPGTFKHSNKTRQAQHSFRAKMMPSDMEKRLANLQQATSARLFVLNSDCVRKYRCHLPETIHCVYIFPASTVTIAQNAADVCEELTLGPEAGVH